MGLKRVSYPIAGSDAQGVVELASATATITSVNDQATSTTILAANTARLGASIYNDSPSILYLKYGTTASATDFTDALNQGDRHEVFGKYTGKIDGIWSADSTGAARITELS